VNTPHDTHDEQSLTDREDAPAFYQNLMGVRAQGGSWLDLGYEARPA